MVLKQDIMDLQMHRRQKDRKRRKIKGAIYVKT